VKIFALRTRVYWEDTDAGGVVYYANYLRFMERARTEWLRTLGYCQRDLASQHGVLFAVTRVRIDYRRPARLDDELSVTCEPKSVGAASVSFAQAISRIDAPDILTQAEVRIACLDAKTFRPARTPEFLLSAFEAQEKLLDAR
jgi:acyl-CoA thioester hydrolase